MILIKRQTLAWLALASALALPVLVGCQGSADTTAQAQREQELSQLREENQELARLRADNQELARLRRDNEELRRLREQTADLEKLRQENSNLRAQIQALKAPKPKP
jgi:cell division protein FtsB